MNRLVLLFQTARHLSPSQIAARLRFMLLRRWRAASRKRFVPPQTYELAAHAPLWTGLAEARNHPGAAARIARAGWIAAGRFQFIGQEKQFDAEPDWHGATASRLWRYHLHYFDYVLDLALTGDYATFRRLVQSWLRANAVQSGDGWHPYTVSLRVVNWCHALGAFAGELDGDSAFRDQLCRAIAGQAHFLAHNCETDVRGNHLIENLRALLWASIAFGGDEARRWRNRAVEMLQREIGEQVLADGAHFERAPGYHLAVLRGLLDLTVFARRNGAALPWLDAAVSRMQRFLAVITGPHDRLPLFKDTTLSDDLTPSDLLRPDSFYATLVGEPPAASPPPPRVAFGEGGYFVVRSDDSFLVADFGFVCPDYLPAHAHADLFSFELTLDGVPQVVDSGVFTYEAGKWRDWFRSTAAHNTVEVEGENQSEVWAAFRVGRRARPRNVMHVESGAAAIIQGEHDGYARLANPVLHRRTIVSLHQSVIVIDQLFGRGTVRATSRVHLHPDATIGVHGFNARRSSEQGWYSERFGEKVSNEVITLEATGAMPLCFGYCVTRAPEVSFDVTGDGEDVAVRVTAGETTSIVVLPKSGAPVCR